MWKRGFGGVWFVPPAQVWSILAYAGRMRDKPGGRKLQDLKPWGERTHVFPFSGMNLSAKPAMNPSGGSPNLGASAPL